MAGAQAQRETPAQRRVLVVDDEPGMIETLSDVLEAHGYHAYGSALIVDDEDEGPPGGAPASALRE